MNALREAFQKFDGDESGFIEMTELDALLGELGLDAADDERVLQALAQLKPAHPHRITWEELSVWWQRFGSPEARARSEAPTPAGGTAIDPEAGREADLPDESQLRELFDSYDEDGSGHIEAGELAHLLEAAGLEPDDEDVVEALERFDYDEDYRLSWSEFLTWWDELMLR